MITYNHEKYIAQAIESVLMQKTDFVWELVIGEDCSIDGTRKICLEYQSRHPDKITVLPAVENLGIRKNGIRTLRACRGRYIAFLEGDDFWTVSDKLQIQVDFLESNPDFVLCFTREDMIDEADSEDVRPRYREIKEISTIEDLCLEDYISSPTVLFRNMENIKEQFFPDCETFDWVLWVFVAQYGKIKFIDKVTAVYRVHEGGVFSKKSLTMQLLMVAQAAKAWKKLIGDRCEAEYRRTMSRFYLETTKAALREGKHELLRECLVNFADTIDGNPDAIADLKYHMIDSQHLITELTKSLDEHRKIIDGLNRNLEESRKQQSLIFATNAWKIGRTITFPVRKVKENLKNIKNRSTIKKRSLIVLDDVYPQALSSFRVAEYNYYLKKIKNSFAYSTGSNFACLREFRSFEEVLQEHVDNYPWLNKKIGKFDPKRPLRAKLAYFVFLGNAYNFLDFLELHTIPFIFTLYPGGGFALDQPWSDQMLKRAFSSPCFRKVIVTQKITFDYLLANQFCESKSVEFIYGGVFPSNLCHSTKLSKKYYLRDKETFDVCFVAHKYTEKGVDKGYDVFIEVAKLLCSEFENINFHVVGPFDEQDIDVAKIKNRVKFHGLLKSDRFPAFYAAQDIILSPNIPFAIMPGAFDGFPTGTCIEAGLNGVVPFITDPLTQNIRFSDREEIVIIPHDSNQIASIVLEYYQNADGLHALSTRTKKSFHDVFGIEAQMGPRLELLRQFL